MNSTIRIVAAVLDTSKLTLYEANGATITLPQGDTRIRRIIDEATPQISEKGFADINMAVDVNNSYMDFEEKSTKVRFFKIAKDKLKSIFGFGSKKEEDPIVTSDNLPTIAQEIIIDEPITALVANAETSHVTREMPANIEKKKMKLVEMSIEKNVIDEIMVHAVKVSDPAFTEESLDKQQAIVGEDGKTPDHPTKNDASHTIIAVTDQNKIIPGMERIKTQFDRAVKLGSIPSVEKFLDRVGAVIKDREHSVEDLLSFLERADLPIAEDGTILIYKVLNREQLPNYPDCQYVDVHTGNVPQWIGARIQMDPKMVDSSRNQDCSHGLHVARRGYVREFPGSVCVLAKLAPEDVIAVPKYNHNKMRVCGYHIIAELTTDQFALIKQNKPLTSIPSGQILLAKGLKGDHIRVTHIVEITGNLGKGIKVQKVLAAPKITEFLPEPVLEPIKEKPVLAVALEDNAEAFDNPVDPKDIVKQIEDQSYRGKITRLYTSLLAEKDSAKQIPIWDEMVLLKKASKKAWENFAIPSSMVTKMTKLKESTSFPFGANAPKEKLNPPKEVIADPPGKILWDDALQKEVFAEESLSVENESYSARILKLASITPMDAQIAEAILNLKRKSKKSWTTLRVPDQIVDQVSKLAISK